MSQSSPTPDPVAWMVADSQGTPRSVRLLESNARYDAMQVKGANVVPLGPIASSALPATTPSDDRAVDRFVARVLADPFCASVTEHALVLEINALREEIANIRATVQWAGEQQAQSAPSEGSAPDTPTQESR